MKTSNQWHHDSADLTKMKILIVDDEPLNVELLRDILVENGYTSIETVTNSGIALDLCRDFQPDLILLDLMMAPLDGFAILEALRADDYQTFLPIIALTADTTEDTKRRALNAGATDFLTKPFDQFEVLLRVENLLASRFAHLKVQEQNAVRRTCTSSGCC